MRHQEERGPKDQRQDTLVLSAELAGSAERLSCCVRHGRSAAQRKDFGLHSLGNSSSRFPRGNLLGLAGRFGEKARNLRVVALRGWPLCDLCARKRAILFALTNVLFWSSLVLILGALIARLILGQPSPSLGAPVMIGFVLLLSSPFVFYVSSIPRLIQAHISDDGESVIVRRPHRNFAKEVAVDDADDACT